MSYQPEGMQPDGYQPDGYQPTGDGSFTPSARSYFRARMEQRGFRVSQSTQEDCDYTFSSVVKDPGAGRKVELDLYELCVNRWRPNEPYEQNEYAHPTRPIGFSLKCTTAGTSGQREPSYWPRTLDATKTEGGVTWTIRPAAEGGIVAIADPTAASDPAGIQITGVSVHENCKILATYGIGGEDGEEYDAVFSFTLDGVPRVARQRILIRKQ